MNVGAFNSRLLTTAQGDLPMNQRNVPSTVVSLLGGTPGIIGGGDPYLFGFIG